MMTRHPAVTIAVGLLYERGELVRAIHRIVDRSRSTCIMLSTHSGSDLVLKLARQTAPGSHSPGAGIGLRKEVQVMKLLKARTAAPVPVPQFHAPIAGGDGYSGLLAMTALDGVAGATVMRRCGDRLRLAIAADAGRILRVVHAEQAVGFGLIDDTGEIIPQQGDYASALVGPALDRLHRLRQGGLLRSDRYKRLAEYILTAAPKPRASYSLLHGDFSLTSNNYLIALDGGPHISGVLDFEWARYGDPWEDLAKTCVNLAPESWQSFFSGYGGPTMTDAPFFVRLEAIRKATWLLQRSETAATAWLNGRVASVLLTVDDWKTIYAAGREAAT